MSLLRPEKNFKLLPVVLDDDPADSELECPSVSLLEQDASDRDEMLKRAQHEES
jgi:hypothetical protein